MGDALGVALHGDRRGEAGDGEGAVELGQGIAHGLADPVTAAKEGDGGDDEEKRKEDGKGLDKKTHATAWLRDGWFGGERTVGEGSCLEGFRFVAIHVLREV